MSASYETSPLTELIRQPDSVTAGTLPDRLGRMLRAIRTFLGMDVAFISEFTDGQRIFRHVDSDSPGQPVREGGSDPLEDSYCQRIIDGRLPGVITDAVSDPEAVKLPVTSALPVGAHLSVPIRLNDGKLYGTFCCFSFTPDYSLNDRDLAMMQVFAELAAEQIDDDLVTSRVMADMKTRVKSVLSDDLLSIVYQPIYHVAHSRVVGFEALSRFSRAPIRTPDVWFAEAGQVGLRIPLELKAMKLALQGIDHLPLDIYVSVNLSPETILHGDIMSALSGRPLERIVLEVTEHSATTHYAEISALVAPLRDQGLRIAVDDAGAGYASFRHILNLAPDIIKLDNSITHKIDADRNRWALARALISFAEATNARIVAEGVETAAELSALRELGVNKAQGYFIGKPASLEAAVEFVQNHALTGSRKQAIRLVCK